MVGLLVTTLVVAAEGEAQSMYFYLHGCSFPVCVLKTFSRNKSLQKFSSLFRFLFVGFMQGAGDLDLGDHDGSTGLELPSDLLLKVKSGGLRRMEAERRELQGANEVAQAEAALKVAGKARRAPKVQDVPRRWVQKE